VRTEDLTTDQLVSMEHLFTARVNIHMAEMKGLDLAIKDIRRELKKREDAAPTPAGGHKAGDGAVTD
jgi:hypothetical protein